MAQRPRTTRSTVPTPVLLVPHTGRRWRYVGHDDALHWLSDADYAYAAGFTTEGALARELDGIALDHVVDTGAGYVGLAASAPRAKRGAVVELPTGRVLQATDAPPIPCGAAHVLVPTAAGTSKRTPATAQAASRYEVVHLGSKRVTRPTIDLPAEAHHVAAGEWLVVAGAGALRIVSLGSGKVREVSLAGRRLPPFIVLSPDHDGTVVFAAVDGSAGAERCLLLRCDPASGRIEVAATFPEGEIVTATARVGEELLVLASDGIRSLTSRSAKLLLPELDGRALTSDADRWVLETDDGRLVIGDTAGARLALTHGDFALLPRHVALGQLVVERSDGVAFAPLASLTPESGELATRVLEVAPSDIEKSPAVVLDHSGNLLRLRTDWSPLLELRTGPIGRGKGDRVTLELVGDDVIAVSWQEKGAQGRARVGEALAVEAPFARAEAYRAEPRKPVTPPKLLSALVELGIVDASALAPRNVRMFVRHLGGRRASDAVLLREILHTFPPAGPRAWLLGVEAGELRHLATDLRNALPDTSLRLRVEEDEDGVAATVEVGVGGAKPKRVALPNWRAPGALAAPINDALASAKLDWVLVDVDLGDEDASWLLTSRQAARALAPGKRAR